MIVIGVPTTGAIPTRVVGSIENVLLTHPQGSVVPVYIEGSLVYDARCQLLNHALRMNADLFFIDSDIVFDREAFDRLVWRDTDIVSGLYYGRREGSPPVAYKAVKPQNIFHKAMIETIDVKTMKPYMEVAGTGLGFCLIRNRVLRSFNTKSNPFEPFGGLGEDFSFFLRCKKNGFKVMLDTTFELTHIGQYGYTAKDYIQECKNE